MSTFNLVFCFINLLIATVFCIDPNLQQSLIASHNNYRRTIASGQGGQPSASNMRELSWDNDLAAKAQEHANRCVINHDTYASRQTSSFARVGQNICLAPDVSVCVGLWYNEKDNYVFAAQTCNKSPCGHYTQLAWASTYKIGCATSPCSGGVTSLVCNYGPAGNEQGADPYTEGFTAAECPPGTTKNNGLCS